MTYAESEENGLVELQKVYELFIKLIDNKDKEMIFKDKEKQYQKVKNLINKYVVGEFVIVGDVEYIPAKRLK